MKKLLQSLLRSLAQRTVRIYRPLIIGITGSVGKTSAKEAVRAVLRAEGRLRAPAKSFNNEFGFPLAILGDWQRTGGALFWLAVLIQGCMGTIFRNSRYPKFLVLEYGIDSPGDMKYLLSIAKPSIGVFTAIGTIPVHVEFFENPRAVLREKAQMIQSLPAGGTAILNADDEWVMEAKPPSGAHIVTFGFAAQADIHIENLAVMYEGEAPKGISFKLSSVGNVVPLRLSGVLGKSHAYAAAAAAAVGISKGMNLVSIGEALEKRYAPVPGRLRILPGIRGSTLIDDSYNASLLAMNEALDALGGLHARRKIAALGDMREIGNYTMEAHSEVGFAVAQKNLDMLLTIGEGGKLIAEGARQKGMPRERIHEYMSVGEAAEFLAREAKKGDCILVKGSQAVRMEFIAAELLADPAKAAELLVRQEKSWLAKPSLYE